MAAGIYEIKHVETGHRYVGSSLNVTSRFIQHRRMLKTEGNHHSIALQRAWNKYGENAFVFNILAILEPDLLKSTEEKLLLQVFEEKTTYNISKNPCAFFRGCKHSEETKLKMHIDRLGNKSRTGYPSHWKGKKLSAEHIAKHAAAVTNPSDETRAKMSAARIGVAPANKGNRQTHCKRGHEMTSTNAYNPPEGRSPHCRECLKINAAKRCKERG